VIISRRKRLAVRMGEFETFEFEAFVSATHQDLGYTDEDLAHRDEPDANITEELVRHVEETLDGLLESDLADAAALTNERKSFIHNLA